MCDGPFTRALQVETSHLRWDERPPPTPSLMLIKDYNEWYFSALLQVLQRNTESSMAWLRGWRWPRAKIHHIQSFSSNLVPVVVLIIFFLYLSLSLYLSIHLSFFLIASSSLRETFRRSTLLRPIAAACMRRGRQDAARHGSQGRSASLLVPIADGGKNKMFFSLSCRNCGLQRLHPTITSSW